MRQKSLLKTMLLLCALIVGSGSAWGEVVSGTTYTTSSTSSLPTGWNGSDGGGTSYIKLIASNNYIQTSEFAQNGFTSIKLKARKYGGPSDAQALITVSWYSNNTETVLGTIAPTNTNLTDYTISSPTNPTANTTGFIRIQCKGAGSSKGSGVSEVTITYTSSGPTTYTVTYDDNDATSGSVPTDNNNYESNASVTVLGNTGELVKTGYAFGGWNTQADGLGTTYSADETFTITANTTLYAKWTLNTHTVTLPAADTYGTYTMNATSPVAYGTEVTLTYTPATGYENYAATWSVNGASISGNEFTMPDEDVTVTVSVEEIVDYATLPFNWEGGASSDLTKMTGVTANGIGSDYAENNNPYNVKLDGTGDYIQIKTDSQPDKVTIGVKMIGGNTNSTITVQGSSNGAVFTTVEVLTISGSQNDVLNLETSNSFAATDRYVRLLFTKGSNIGVGPISIERVSTDPVINAEASVNIEYNATSGEIAYTITNPLSNTDLTASVEDGCDWISDVTVGSKSVTFTTTVNTAVSARLAVITLTYGELTKEVTVTQTGNPDAFNNISDITAVSTSYKVKGTVVATNDRGFVIGDGTGYVYTYLNATPSQSVGDKVSITGTTGTYGHILQFTSSATIAEATTSNYDNTPAITAVDATSIAAFNSDYQLSDYVQLEGSLAKNSSNYEITVGSATARISYPTAAQTTALDALVDKDVRVKGYFAGFSSSTFTVMMESVEEIFIPKLSIGSTTVDPFTYEENEDLSDEQIITVTGTNLTGEITVSVTGEYELISETENGVSSLTLTSGDYFAVNLKDNLTAGDYNGVLTIASEGATSIVINLTGTVTPYVAPAIEATQTTVNVGAADGDGTISITYTKIDTDLVDVKFYESNGTTPATYDWIDAEIDSENNNLYYTFGANTGEARTAYLKVYGVDNKGGDSYIYSELIAITQAKYEFPGSWVAANLADINANDVFVIVGDNGSTYAMTNNNSTSKAPDVVEVTVIDNTLSGTIADNIKWNVTYDTKNEGYIFNPNGSTNTWLYCTNTNNGVRVGTGDAKHFNLSGGYLTTTETTDQRYIGIYNSQDWRCYDNKIGNIANQTFTFYKKLAAKLNAYGYATFSATVPVDFSLADGFSAWAITAISGTSITFSQITGAVPANTGVLLKGAAGETVYLAATASDTEPSSNLLEAITTATSIEDGKYYGLSGNTFVPVSAGTIPAGKALLPASAVQSGARLTFVFEEANGISAVESVKTMAEGYYNLQGQRIDTPKKGLYIVNGKKVIIK